MRDGKKMILTINPGSTSLKIALYKETECVVVKNLKVKITDYIEDIDKYDKGIDAAMKIINDFFQEENVNVSELDIVVSRVGCTQGVMKTGAYAINELLLNALKYKPLFVHSVIVGPAIAVAIAKPLGIPAIVYDSENADEADDFVHMTGLPEIKRMVVSHALNGRMMARELAGQLGKKYEELNMIVVHIGGGVSICATEKGRVIDSVFVDDGPIAPTRAGSLPTRQLAELCFSGKYTLKEIIKLLSQTGGLIAYLNTSDAQEIEQMIKDGNEKAGEIYYCMAYAISKCIGQMAAVLSGQIDCILMTGGIAYSKIMTDWISEKVQFLAPIYIIPGENEMKALALGGLRVLNAEETPKIFDVLPDGYSTIDEFYKDCGINITKGGSEKMAERRLEGKVAIVTGGGSGIGSGIVKEFINEGAKVGYFDAKKSEEDLGEGGSCIFYQCDVSNEEQIKQSVAAVVKKFGHLDVYVNSAGIGGFPSFITDSSLEAWESVIKVNLIGTFLGLKTAANQMIKQNKGGVIINISSLNSTVPNEWLSAYCTSKAGVDMLSKVAAMELGPQNIRVCTINPGFTQTPMLSLMTNVPGVTEEAISKTPLKRMAVPRDIAQAAVFLASDAASFITGSHMYVDGGQATQGYPDVLPLVVDAMKAQGLL